MLGRKNSRAMFRLLQADGNISINKNLIHAIGLNEAIIYCELLSRHSYFDDRKLLQDDGSFFNTIYDLQLGTGLGEKAQRTAIKNLEQQKLLKCKVRGVPARRYFYMNFDIDLDSLISKGEEVMEKLKEIIIEKQADKQAARLAKSTVSTKAGTCSDDNRNLVVLKQELAPAVGYGNNTNNNTNYNNTNSIIIEGSEEWEGTPNGDTHSIPYSDYLLSDIKRFKTEYKSDIVEIILYYCGKFQETFEMEHVRYGEEMRKEIYSRIDTILSIGVYDEYYDRYYPATTETVKAIIDQHFKTKYKGNIKWTLLSFLNDKILINRYRECC